MIREPAVAGSFYDDNVRYLIRSIEECFNQRLGIGKIPKLSRIKKNKEIHSVMLPHAGYYYSGPVASHGISKIVEDGFPEIFVIIGPNHTGLGEEVSVFNEGAWITPLGHVEVDSEFSNELIANSEFAKADFIAHEREHSCEIQLPFLQYFSNDFKIVPICMMNQSPEAAFDLANAIFLAREKLGRNITVIDSTDLSHFKSQDLTIKLDKLVLNDISNCNSERLYETVKNNQITMCGYGPTMVAIEYSKKLGLNHCEILKHATSGDISLDYASVVGYASGFWK